MNRRLLAPAVIAAAAVCVAATTLTAATASPLVPATSGVVGTLDAAVPAWALGVAHSALPADTTFPFVVQLQTRHASALHDFARAVSDPSSPSYQHFLTPAQYRARYAPLAGSVTAVTTWLTAAGLDVVQTSPDGTYLTVRGTAARIGSAFDTSFAQFDVDGVLRRAPLSAPVLPSAVRDLIANVSGLADTETLHPDDTTPPTAFVNARPCSQHYGQKTATKQPKYQGEHQPYAICGYVPAQLRSAYGLPSKLTGKGATIGIVDAYASPTILDDANAYATKHGDKPFADGQFEDDSPPGLSYVPNDPVGLLLDPQGWSGEETLDVEAVHGMAPDAKVIYQGALTPVGPMLYVAVGQLVESGNVQVISNSYGSTDDAPDPTEKALFDQVTDQAAATGITLDFSSGDSGDETDKSAQGKRTADFPATSDGVVAVGGTSLHIDKAGQRTSETYWGTRKDVLNGAKWDFKAKDVVYAGGGGGGVSTSYAEPEWQLGVVPDSLATFGGVTAGRVLPDVSMDADSTTGMLVGQTETFADGSVKYGEYRIGGTSLSCPLFSGLLALAIQKHDGKGLGLITPTLYGASKSPKAIAKLFFDPSKVAVDKQTKQTVLANVRPDYTDPSDPSSKVLYSLRTLGNLDTLHALVGYDDSTGLGVPRAAAIIGLLG